jgi:hypothetical protein
VTTAPPTLAVPTIERRFGDTAAAEWQVLLNQLELAEEFALVVLVVPDMDGARLCRRDLEAWLAKRDRHLAVIEPAIPVALHEVAATLLSLPDDPAYAAVWLAAAHGPPDVDAEAWALAWRHALVGLNQQRNPLRRRFPLPPRRWRSASGSPATNQIVQHVGPPVSRARAGRHGDCCRCGGC